MLFLDGGAFTIGEHDENADILFATEAVDCGAACVTTRSTNDSEMMPGLTWWQGFVTSDGRLWI